MIGVFSLGLALVLFAAYCYDERTNLQLHGLLPPRIETLEEQVSMAFALYAVAVIVAPAITCSRGGVDLWA